VSRHFRQPDRVPATRFSEEQLQDWVVTYARLQGWLAYHTLDSRGSESGFPDLVLVRGGVVLFRELKTETGVVSPAQGAWITALEGAGQDVAVWRPRDEKTIEAALKRRRETTTRGTAP
jgi:hypothetical protein